MTPAPKRGWLFWASAAAGWALILWGVRGALHHRIDTRPGQLARFLLGGALAHDLVLAPLVLLAGTALARIVRGRWRAPLQAALFVSGTLLLFTYPALRGPRAAQPHVAAPQLRRQPRPRRRRGTRGNRRGGGRQCQSPLKRRAARARAVGGQLQ